jgi:hypothetical protein
VLEVVESLMKLWSGVRGRGREDDGEDSTHVGGVVGVVGGFFSRIQSIFCLSISICRKKI